MRRRWRFRLHSLKIFYIAVGVFPFAIGAFADERPKPLWTVSLKPQGYHRHMFNPTDFTMVGGVAVTEETVGVALGNHTRPNMKLSEGAPWEVVVVLYQSKTGRFVSQKSAWLSGLGFKLVSTSKGNFLLFLAPVVDGTRYIPGKLVLLSPSGEQLKELQFEFAGERPRPGGIQFYNSPSGRTGLIAAKWAGEVRYEVLNVDSLEISLDWVELEDHRKKVPWVTQISDDQMFGATDFNTYHAREFSGEWKGLPLPVPQRKVVKNNTFQPNGPIFLKDRVFVGQAYETEDEFVIPTFLEDGTVLSRNAMRKLPDYNYFRMPTIVSQDGRYFAIRLMHENKLTHWWDADMDMDATGAGYLLYVWQPEVTSPIALIEISRYALAVSFFPPGIPDIAILDDDKLKVFPLPKNPSPSGKALR